MPSKYSTKEKRLKNSEKRKYSERREGLEREDEYGNPVLIYYTTGGCDHQLGQNVDGPSMKPSGRRERSVSLSVSFSYGALVVAGRLSGGIHGHREMH